MAQFSINWRLTDIKVCGVRSGQYFSELKLDNKWTVVCYWMAKLANSSTFFAPDSIEFRRVSTSDVVSISGSLTFKDSYTNFYGGISIPKPVLKFSKFMESGCSSIAVDFKDVTGSLAAVFCLVGDVNITSYTNSPNKECIKCVELKKQVDILDDLGRLLEPETCCFADVTLKCVDASIPAHKNILSARSPVFATMFKNPMKENLTNEVVISDMDASVLRIMLTYVYTGKLSNLTVSSASDLLFASDKYQIADLKRACCSFMKGNMSPQNVLKILLLGELFCDDLKSCAIDFICNTCSQFSVLEETEEWKTMRSERPNLAVDILTSVVKAREKKI